MLISKRKTCLVQNSPEKRRKVCVRINDYFNEREFLFVEKKDRKKRTNRFSRIKFAEVTPEMSFDALMKSHVKLSCTTSKKSDFYTLENTEFFDDGDGFRNYKMEPDICFKNIQADVKFRWEKPKKTILHCHRVILQESNCLYFHGLFSYPWLENKAEFIDIQESFEDFYFLMRFLYKPRIDLNLEEALTIYSMASKFAFKTLLDECDISILHNLSIQNMGKILELAYRHDSERIKFYIFMQMLEKGEEILNYYEEGSPEHSNFFKMAQLIKLLKL